MAKEKLTRAQRAEIRLNEHAKAFYSKFAPKSPTVKAMNLGEVRSLFGGAYGASNTDEEIQTAHLAEFTKLDAASMRRPMRGYLRALGNRNAAGGGVMATVKKFEKLSAKIDKENARHDAAIRNLNAEIDKLGGKDAIRAEFDKLAARFK